MRKPFLSPSRSALRLQTLATTTKPEALSEIIIRARSSYLLAFNLHLNLTSLFDRRNMRKVMKYPIFCLFMLCCDRSFFVLRSHFILTWRCLLFDPLESSPKDLIQDWTASFWFWTWNFLFWGSRKARKTNLRFQLENYKLAFLFSKKLLSPRASIR